MSSDAQLILKRACSAERWNSKNEATTIWNVLIANSENNSTLTRTEILQSQARQASPKREEPPNR